jgi:hypothetical protein
MISLQDALSERLKRLGYSEGQRIRLYGEEFDLVSNPITIQDELFFVDGVERKSGKRRRIRIPLTVIQMIRRDVRAA